MAANYRQLFERTRSAVHEVDVAEASRMIRQGAQILDIREPDEVEQGVIPGATHIPRGWLESRVEELVPEKEQPVLVYCAGGVRSVFAAKTMQELGYAEPVSLAGGIGAWKARGLPIVIPQAFTPEQRRRYSRHFLLPEVGEAGQRALLDAKVLVVGAGGLGSPAAFYLAAAGVGTLGIIDDDVVDDSNLQREILHSTERIGLSKVESARQTLTALNPDVTVIGHETRLDKENVFEILGGYDIIVDGTDNFATRYLINDVAVLLGKPVVHGSIFRFEGQTTIFTHDGGPCYRCLFPDPPPPELAPNCAEAGVLGALPGVIGVIQATEALKLILGIGESLSGRLLMYDALGMEFRELRLRRDPDCPMCGADGPDTIEHIDYTDAGCAVPALAGAR
jgi:adenylyltransferase/sulfurtransferase